MTFPAYRHETVAEAVAALAVHPSYVDTATKIHDRTRKVRIEYAHAGDKHFAAMIGWIVQMQSGEYRLLSKPTGKSRKLPPHIWRIDPIGRGSSIPYYLCPALRKESAA